MKIRELNVREAGLIVLTCLSLFAVAVFATGAIAERGSRHTLASWDAARHLMPTIGCGVCGSPARYDVSRLVRRQGEVVGRVPLGLRCDLHREAETAKAESGLYTAWMLEGLGALVFAIALFSSALPIWRATPHPFWIGARIRPVRRGAFALSCTVWLSVFAYILAVSFKDAYATLPLWTAMGGMLCVWLYDLLSGGEYLRCTGCSWHGNMGDLAHATGICPRCSGAHFRVQELLRAQRIGLKTTYHFRMMVGLTFIQLGELERDGRIWKEPRGSWSPPRVLDVSNPTMMPA